MSEKFDALLIDAGTGNLHSVHNALLSLGYAIRITSRPEDLAQPARVILPGVGAFARFMDGLRAAGLEEPLQTAVQRGDPMLGICVGMQALFEVGEEMGQHPGLGLLPGKVVRKRFAVVQKHTPWRVRLLQSFLLLCCRSAGRCAGPNRLRHPFPKRGAARIFICRSISPRKKPAGGIAFIGKFYAHWIIFLRNNRFAGRSKCHPLLFFQRLI